jgi:hypothetical protein
MAKIETPGEIHGAKAHGAIAQGSVRPHRSGPGIPADGSSDPDAGEYAAARHVSRLGDAPGLAKARARRSELLSELADTTRSSIPPDVDCGRGARLLDPELLGDDDVLDDDAAIANELFARSRAARVGGAKVPMANLEPPSPTRLELTPSPVPRVQLEPATGTVDISLVPGPNAVMSRNMPTIAAQHALGRRGQVRREEARGDQGPPAAPAMTLPPTGVLGREPRVTARASSAEVPREFRSSKREVVLGLGIGLGLSMLLAAVGQAYLRDDVVAERHGAPGSRDPAAIESITLSARPESAPSTTGAQSATRSGALASSEATLGKGTDPAPGKSTARNARQTAAGSARDDSTGSDSMGSDSTGSDSMGSDSMGSDSTGLAALESAASGRVARVTVSSERGSSERVQPLTERQRGERGPRVAQRSVGRERERERRSMPIATQPPVFEVEKPLSDAPPERAPLSPAESAGLGLDLPL